MFFTATRDIADPSTLVKKAYPVMLCSDLYADTPAMYDPDFTVEFKTF